MRTSFRLAAVALVVAIGLTASGCATDDPAPKPSTSTSAAPLFASEEEALAAAEEAYAAYKDVEDEILANGGLGGERIQPVAVRDARQAALEGFQTYVDNGYKSVGQVVVNSTKLQAFHLRPDTDRDIVSTYLCLDFSRSDVIDAEGKSVVREGRLLRQLFVASFDQGPGAESSLILSSIEPWGSDPCDE